MSSRPVSADEPIVEEYSVWLLPAAAQQERLTAVVKHLAGCFGGEPFIPHITIQGDLSLPFTDLSAAVSHIARTHDVQRWSNAVVEGSEHFFRSLYVRFPVTACYLRLRQQMQQTSANAAGLSLFPHLSLAYGATAAQKTPTLYEELRPLAMEPLVLDRIAIARSSKNAPISHWACLAEFPLMTV